MKIPQVDTSGMSNEEKAKISPINRLEGMPTEAEEKWFSAMLKHGMDSKEYADACKALKKERGEE